METEYHTRLNDIRLSLEKNDDDGFPRLVDFVSEVSVDKRLRARTLVLANEVLSAQRDFASAARGALSLDAFQADILDIVATAQKEIDETSLGLSMARRRVAKDRLRGRKIDHRVVVEAIDLGKQFNQFALKGVDLKLRLGTITGVVGENANGKTTLFRMLVGELKPSTGRLCYPELGAQSPAQINWAGIRRQIAYVPQSLKAWHGSLEDNLRYAAASRGITGRQNDEEFDYITTRLGLAEYLNRSWHEISGGYQLRFELARALIWRPKLLVLDEPLANLDFKAQLVLLRDVQALARSYTAPIAVMISSQHLHEVEAVADDILFLRRGDVLYNGPSSDVGKDRTFNSFELNTSATVPEIRTALAGLQTKQIYFNGMSVVVEGGLELSSAKLLERLSMAGITITYFRDISNSVKQLFEQSSYVS